MLYMYTVQLMKDDSMKPIYKMLAVSCLVMSVQSQASTLSAMPNNFPDANGVANSANCTSDSFVITNLSDTATGTPIPLPSAKETTSCGRYHLQPVGNGNSGSNRLTNFVANNLPDSSANIGALGDGFLNTSDNLDVNGTTTSLWTEFLTSDRLLDLNGDGNAIDPGYIHLGTQGKNLNSDFVYNSVLDQGAGSGLTVEDFVTVDFTCTSGKNKSCYGGDWTVAVDQNAVANTQALLGQASTFDQLVFTIRAGGNADWGGLGVYVLDFTQEFDAGLDNLTPFTFSGTWNSDDFTCCNVPATTGRSQAMTRIDVFARDPIDANAPGTIGIFLLGAAGLVARRMTKK